MKRVEIVTIAPWKIWIGSLFCFLIGASATPAQEPLPSPVLRRVLLLPPLVPDTAIQRWIVTERAAMAQEPRRGGLLGLFSKKKKAPPPAKPGSKTKTDPKEPTGPLPEASPEQLRAWSEIRFYEDLSTRLRTKRHLSLPTEAEVRAAAATLQLSPTTRPDDVSLRRLGRSLDCDAVLIPELTHIERNEGVRRSVTLRGGLRCLLLAPAERPSAALTGKRPRQSPAALPSEFPFFGTESAGHVAFQNGYSRTAAQLATEASHEAAAVAAHTLWTGEITPFARAEERIALLPVPAPTDADALLFTPTGRRVAQAAVRDLPADLADQFQPNVEPMSGKDVVPVERSRAEMKEEGITVETLWRQDQPEGARVQILGKRLGASYVLMVRILTVELQTGTPDPGQTFATRESHAEAVGALVRVADGVVLWQDHAGATMTLHPVAQDKPQSIDKQAVLQAEHFALTALQRRFQDYRDHFEN